MLSSLEKKIERRRTIDNAERQFRELQEDFGVVTKEVIRENFHRPRTRAMLLSLLTNGGVDFPDL